MKSPFEAKRVIVAGCAAIAMVLGAMSAGASVSSSQMPTASKAEVSSIVKAASPRNSTPTSVTTGLTKKHTIEGRDFFQQPDTTLYGAPAKQDIVIKNTVAAVFNAASPALFLNQIVQVQQPSVSKTEDLLKSESTQPVGTATTPTPEPVKEEPAAGTTSPEPATDTLSPAANPDPVIEPLSVTDSSSPTPSSE